VIVEHRQRAEARDGWTDWQTVRWAVLADAGPERWANYLLHGIDGRVITIADPGGHREQYRYRAERSDHARTD
jgi:hypothetical protein